MINLKVLRDQHC